MPTGEQVTKKQHYLPEMYLKNFAGNDGKLWKKSLKYGNYRQVTPAQICYKPFLYEIPWKCRESHKSPFALLNYLENRFREREKVYSDCILSVCKKVCADNPCISDITDTERTILAEFTVNLLLRHPYIMDVFGIDNLSPEDWLDHVLTLKKLFGVETETVARFAKKCQWLDPQFPGGYFQTIQKIFENMGLTFFVTKNREFITCDWPFIGALTEGQFIAFVLPITPNFCICYNRLPIEGKINVIPDNMVLKYNSLHIEKESSRITNLLARNKDDIEVLFKKSR